MAHITGGGIAGNLVRVLPENCKAEVDVSEIPIPPIFELIRTAGDIPLDEMFDVFNMGAGYIIVVEESALGSAIELCAQAGFPAVPCGEIVSGKKSVMVRPA